MDLLLRRVRWNPIGVWKRVSFRSAKVELDLRNFRGAKGDYGCYRQPIKPLLDKPITALHAVYNSPHSR
jgi:hypothetical protein